MIQMTLAESATNDPERQVLEVVEAAPGRLDAEQVVIEAAARGRLSNEVVQRALWRLIERRAVELSTDLLLSAHPAHPAHPGQ
jgi:hypothetical protein